MRHLILLTLILNNLFSYAMNNSTNLHTLEEFPVIEDRVQEHEKNKPKKFVLFLIPLLASAALGSNLNSMVANERIKNDFSPIIAYPYIKTHDGEWIAPSLTFKPNCSYHLYNEFNDVAPYVAGSCANVGTNNDKSFKCIIETCKDAATFKKNYILSFSSNIITTCMNVFTIFASIVLYFQKQ